MFYCVLERGHCSFIITANLSSKITSMVLNLILGRNCGYNRTGKGECHLAAVEVDPTIWTRSVR